MLSCCDVNNEVIVNYLSNLPKDMYGLNKISSIFFNVKNNIVYDENERNQNASETLVMGYGNNLDKNILLYTLLEGLGIKTDIVKADVRSSLRAFANRGKIFSWYYVNVYFLNRKIALDATFDRVFMNAWGIKNKSKNMNYSIENYYIGVDKLFFIINTKKLQGGISLDTKALCNSYLL